MTAFKPGDRALVPAEVAWMAGTSAGVLIWDGDRATEVTVPSEDLLPAPELPYVDPELVPGMVVMAKGASGGPMWHYLPDGVMDPSPFRGERGWCRRAALPDEIRPVFDPREVQP